jgi:threonine dehydratase
MVPATHEYAVDRESIAVVEAAIRPHIRRTPILEVGGAEFDLGDVQLTFKLELLQHSGSFKARGAFANLLLRSIPEAGVVAASGGNHGVAVAFAASRLRVPARIFLPTCSPQIKVDRIRSYGADLVITGELYADALEASRAWAAESGALPVHAFDQVETMLGQGTLAYELESQAPDLDTVIVPVGGGGLVSGVAAWYGHRVNVVGVEPELAPTLSRALAAGHPVDAPAGGVAADSLAPKRVGDQVFPIASQSVAKVLLVKDDDITTAQRTLWERMRIAAEPGGAAGFAAVLSGRYQPASGERVGVVISGGNTGAVDFGR